MRFCELAAREGVIPAAERRGYDYYYGLPYNEETGEYGFSSAVLPGMVRDWAGMFSSLGYVGEDLDNIMDDSNQESWLTSLNDNGKSFDEIADIIDQKWATL